MNLTFTAPCIVMCSYNENQRDAPFLTFISDKELYMFQTDLLSIIRSLNTVYTAIGISHASFDACLLARSGCSILTSLAAVNISSMTNTYCCTLYTWVTASWIELNNFTTRCDLFSLLHFCRQLYKFRALTPIIRSSYNCKYSLWYWLTGSTTIRSRCWAETGSVPT